MTEGSDGKLLKTGIVGSVIVALCCFTPILVLVLGAVGLSAVLGWIDYVLLPALAFFIALTVFAVWRRHGINATPERTTPDDTLLFHDGRVWPRLDAHLDPDRGHGRADLPRDQAR